MKKQNQDESIPYILESEQSSKESRKNWAMLIQKIAASPGHRIKSGAGSDPGKLIPSPALHFAADGLCIRELVSYIWHTYGANGTYLSSPDNDSTGSHILQSSGQGEDAWKTMSRSSGTRLPVSSVL